MSEGTLRLLHTPIRDLRAVRPAARTVVVVTGLIVVAVLVYMVARETSMFAVTKIDVTGAPPAVAVQARRALADVNGQNLLKLNGSDVVGTLEALPTVYRAGYDRDFPHTLRVRIVPEEPVAVLRHGADSWVASARGRVISAVQRGSLPSLPRVWLPATSAVRVGAILSDPAGSLAAHALRSFRGIGLGRRITFVKVTDGRLVAGLRGGLELRFGPPVDLGLKLAVARSILPTLAAPSAGGPRYLDLAVPERPVAGTDPQVEG
jgi:cell division septal protein FtsQ